MVPLSGLVVLTDGADNSRSPIADELLSLRARQVPVFTVGIGSERFTRDVEVRRVETASTVLKGSTLMADVLVRQRGFSGATVPLMVEDDGRVIATDRDRAAARRRRRAGARQGADDRAPGPRVLTFRIPLQAGEQVTQNNAQQALVRVRDTREKILYVEGEPRYEVRFVRAAVEADSNLQLVVAAAHRGPEVSPAERGRPAGAGQRLSDDARRTLRVPRDHRWAASRPASSRTRSSRCSPTS